MFSGRDVGIVVVEGKDKTTPKHFILISRDVKMEYMY